MPLRRIDRQHLDLDRALGHALAHLGELLLRHGEVDVDRPHLVDHHQRVDVVRLDQITGLQQHLADEAIERRADRAVLEVEARILERGLARLRHGR